MATHFVTRDEQILDYFAKIDPVILKTIEDNREEFMALMAKFYDQMGENLISVTRNLKEKSEETPAEDKFVDEVKHLVLATYLVSFLVQGIPEINDVLQVAHHTGVEDGYAFTQVRRMRRN
jgi:hypothetical protein